MKLVMPSLLGRRREKLSRQFERFSCQIDSSITLIDRMISFEGRIFDLSRGGALFRPKLAYIIRRSDVPICIHLGSEELFGHIVSTSPKGFSVRFDEPLDEELFNEVTADLQLGMNKTA